MMWLQKFREKGKSERIYFFLTFVIRLSLILAIIGAVWETATIESAWMTLFVSSLALLFTFVPLFIQRTYKVRLPGEIQIIIVLFIYASLFLGMAQEWYGRFWWWDSLMHGFSGVALGFTGFLILYVLYKSGKLQASAFLIVMFSFCFAVALGAVWEIFEFGIDTFFGDNMQRARFTIEKVQESEYNGLYRLQCMTTAYKFEDVEKHEKTRVAIYDTMWDMILNSIGALLASISGFLYLKKGEIFLFDKLIGKFEQVNPELFDSEGENNEKEV